VSRFENFILQAKARAIEDNIDFKQVEEQRSRLIDTFHAELKDRKDEIKAIVQKSLAFRLREITAEDYYHFLVKAARDNGIDLDRFPLVLEYAKYLSFYYKMDKSKIIDEIAQLETYIKKELYQNDVEAELDYLAKVMSVLKRLFRLEVIKADYEFFLNNKADFNFRATKDFILEHGKQYGVYLGFDVNYQVVEDNLHWVLDFYDAALRRDRVLLENAVKQMEDRGEDRFALITGGFHSDGLTNQMKEKNIPYILVAPRILDPTADTPYEDVMRAQADSVRGYRGIVE
jgi:hypothetical protein